MVMMMIPLVAVVVAHAPLGRWAHGGTHDVPSNIDTEGVAVGYVAHRLAGLNHDVIDVPPQPPPPLLLLLFLKLLLMDADRLTCVCSRC